jgi:hypothetical protein
VNFLEQAEKALFCHPNKILSQPASLISLGGVSFKVFGSEL